MSFEVLNFKDMNFKGRQRTEVGERHLGLGNGVQKSTCNSDTVTFGRESSGVRRWRVTRSPFDLGLPITEGS